MSIQETTSPCVICSDPIAIPEGKKLSEYVQKTIGFTGDTALSPTLEPVVTMCNHVFHQICLKGWIDTFLNKTQSPFCPLCRESLGDPHVANVAPRTFTPIVQHTERPFDLNFGHALQNVIQAITQATRQIILEFPPRGVYIRDNLSDPHQQQAQVWLQAWARRITQPGTPSIRITMEQIRGLNVYQLNLAMLCLSVSQIRGLPTEIVTHVNFFWLPLYHVMTGEYERRHEELYGVD